MKTPRTKAPTEAEWLTRIKAATLLQSLHLDIVLVPWLRQLCIDVLRACHGTSPEFEAAALSWLTPGPPTITVGVFFALTVQYAPARLLATSQKPLRVPKSAAFLIRRARTASQPLDLISSMLAPPFPILRRLVLSPRPVAELHEFELIYWFRRWLTEEHYLGCVEVRDEMARREAGGELHIPLLVDGFRHKDTGRPIFIGMSGLLDGWAGTNPFLFTRQAAEDWLDIQAV